MTTLTVFHDTFVCIGLSSGTVYVMINCVHVFFFNRTLCPFEAQPAGLVNLRVIYVKPVPQGPPVTEEEDFSEYIFLMGRRD